MLGRVGEFYPAPARSPRSFASGRGRAGVLSRFAAQIGSGRLDSQSDLRAAGIAGWVIVMGRRRGLGGCLGELSSRRPGT